MGFRLVMLKENLPLFLKYSDSSRVMMAGFLRVKTLPSVEVMSGFLRKGFDMIPGLFST